MGGDEDPDSDDVRLLAAVRRDHEKAVRVPAALAAEMSHADALGQQAWQEARAAADFSRFRDALARHVELRHRYVECFEPAEHPYDILLDDFEPGLTTASCGRCSRRCATSSWGCRRGDRERRGRATTAPSPARSRSTTSAAP